MTLFNNKKAYQTQNPQQLFIRIFTAIMEKIKRNENEITQMWWPNDYVGGTTKSRDLLIFSVILILIWWHKYNEYIQRELGPRPEPIQIEFCLIKGLKKNLTLIRLHNSTLFDIIHSQKFITIKKTRITKENHKEHLFSAFISLWDLLPNT